MTIHLSFGAMVNHADFSNYYYGFMVKLENWRILLIILAEISLKVDKQLETNFVLYCTVFNIDHVLSNIS